MFEQFKERLQHVQQDLSASIKNLTTKAKEVGIGKRITEHNDPLSDSSINVKPCRYEAGAELLNKFQSSWADVHNDIERAATRATAVDGRLNNVLRDYEKRTESLHQLHKHLHELPIILQDIQTATVTVGRMQASFEELETMITNYEDLVEREEFKRNQINKRKELHKYESQKNTEYARTKAHLQAENEQLVKEFEKAEEAKMKERQQAFEEVFTAEMDHYKQHGKVNEKVVQREKTSTSSIDDFEFQVDDTDKLALDDFLGGAEVTTKTKIPENIQEIDDEDENDQDDNNLEDIKEEMNEGEINDGITINEKEENVEEEDVKKVEEDTKKEGKIKENVLQEVTRQKENVLEEVTRKKENVLQEVTRQKENVLEEVTRKKENVLEEVTRKKEKVVEEGTKKERKVEETEKVEKVATNKDEKSDVIERNTITEENVDEDSVEKKEMESEQGEIKEKEENKSTESLNQNTTELDTNEETSS
ncbi:dysbindin-like [Antedon mediterranea]|uniref:dysbindin-like n=1 Tax=Antedon mediterranea TaxID=105859 RepID=UPI003AF9CB3C